MLQTIADLAKLAGLTPSVVWALIGVAAALAFGSIVRAILLIKAPAEERREKLGSLTVWWTMLLLCALAAVGGPAGGVLLCGAVSLWAVHEYASLIEFKYGRTPGKWCLFAAIFAHYGCLYFGWPAATWMLILVLTLLGIAASAAFSKRSAGYFRTACALAWGALLLVYFFSHAALLLFFPDAANAIGGAAGWFLFLVFLTEANDIAQALWGRQFGRSKIAPRLSPNKTWEGFLLGMLTTIFLAIALAPWLTPLTESAASLPVKLPRLTLAAAGGLLVACCGFAGDLAMSAVKRHVGVKDSGNLLPGQGGILDRIDSLTFSAPAFYYYIYWLYIP